MPGSYPVIHRWMALEARKLDPKRRMLVGKIVGCRVIDIVEFILHKFGLGARWRTDSARRFEALVKSAICIVYCFLGSSGNFTMFS